MSNIDDAVAGLPSKQDKATHRIRYACVLNGKATDVHVPCASETTARKKAQSDKAPKQARIIDVEELVSHTWMLRSRWVRKNAKAQWKRVKMKAA